MAIAKLKAAVINPNIALAFLMFLIVGLFMAVRFTRYQSKRTSQQDYEF